MKNCCPKCNEIYLNLNQIFKIRHDTHSRPVEQKVEVKCCPECGTELISFNEYAKERVYL